MQRSATFLEKSAFAKTVGPFPSPLAGRNADRQGVLLTTVSAVETKRKMANTGIYEDDYASDSSLGVDSDEESNFDSPADGYFSERPHPRETFVENSSISAAAEAKARERAEERASSSAAVPPSQLSSPTSQRSVDWAEPEAPQVNQEAPPPDYESAISSPPSTQNQGPRYLGQSLGGDEQPSAQQLPPGDAFVASGMPVAAQVVTFGRPANHQPQSMRDAAVIPVDEETGLLTGTKGKKKRRRWLGGCCKSMSLCNIILFVAIVILVIVVAGAADDQSESDNPKEPNEGDDGNDGTPADPVIPPKQPAVVPPATSQCPYDWFSETRIFDFNKPQNFSLVELMESSNWVSDNIRGTIKVQPAQKEQDVDIRLHIDYATTSPWRVVSSDGIKTHDAFVLQLPVMKKTEHSGSEKPCLYVSIRVDLRPGVVLDDWELSTGNLNIEVADGLFNRKEGEEGLSALQVAGSSVFNAVRGAVSIEYWSSRETEVDTISGSIRGSFALRDLLSLNSQSGTIRVNVDPREADPKNPMPAEFKVNSRSGSVKVDFPMKGEIPERQYSSRVETMSASISGDFILGELTSFHSVSGTIQAQLLPYFDRKHPSTMHTDTRSGTTKLRVLQPYAHPGEGWSLSHSIHKSISTSGSIDILYPDEWSGMIDERSLTGSLSAKGKGVRIISNGKEYVDHHLIAQKEYGGSGEMAFKTTTGSIKVMFGEE